MDFAWHLDRNTRELKPVLLSEGTIKLKKIGILCPAPEGRPKCDWVIVDAGYIIVHLFRQEIRDLYSLEKLWNINFDNIETKLV